MSNLNVDVYHAHFYKILAEIKVFELKVVITQGTKKVAIMARECGCLRITRQALTSDSNSSDVLHHADFARFTFVVKIKSDFCWPM